jgi:N utilization substance protein B
MYLIQALYQWELSRDDPGEILVQFTDLRDLGSADVDYFRELMRAIPAEVERLDAAIEPLLQRSLALVDPVERSILRLACYELHERWEVPARVVIDEAVELAKRFGAHEGHRFINGVVDRLAHRIRVHELGA